MNNRLLELRKKLSLSQSVFAQKINLKQTTISELEKGVRPLPDRVIADVCREYNVNEQWLREGVGPMFCPKPTDENALAEIAAKLIKSNDPMRIKVAAYFLKMLLEQDNLVDDFKKYVRDFNDSLEQNK